MGYDHVSSLGQMKQKDQEKRIHDFCYGNKNGQPSNIDLLIQGIGPYEDMWDPVFVPTTSKEGTKEDVQHLQLKPELINCYDKIYIAGRHIVAHDLKRTNRTGKGTLPQPRTSLVWSKDAIRQFKKAESFCSRWWDPVANEPRKDKGGSGLSADDVRENVINTMWEYEQNRNPDVESDDEVDESAVDLNDTQGDEEEGEEGCESPSRICNDADEQAPHGWCWKGCILWFRHGMMNEKSKRLKVCLSGKFL